MSSRLHSALRVTCLVGMTASVGYYAACLVATGRFFARPRPRAPEPLPGMTILKPVKGMDDEAYDNFASFCRQNYPARSYQLIFGVNRADDPAVALIRRLQADFPWRDIKLVIAERDLGPNGKVSSLAQMVEHADHDLLAISDADMRVGSEYLRHLAAAFADPLVGLATCPYRGAEPRNLPAALLALGINAEFVPSVFLTEQLEGLSFALGATMAIRKQALAAIGGFAPLANYLADDYLLGNRTLQAGYKVVLVPYVVDHVVRRESWRDYLSLQLRWARTVRVCRPVGYFASIVAHGPAFALAYLLLARRARRPWLLPAGVATARVLSAATIGRSYLGARLPLRYLWLLPLRDLLGTALWAAAILGNRVTWRGRSFRLGRAGTLLPE